MRMASQESQEGPDCKAAHQAQSQSGEKFPVIAGAHTVAYRRGVPWYRVGPLCEIFFVFHHETCSLNGLESGCSFTMFDMPLPRSIP